MDDAHEEFLLTLGDQPLGVELDPDNWILNTAVDLAAGVRPDTDEPVGLRLEAVPNPFTRSTAVRFAVSRSQHVRIDVFTAAGRRLENLMDGEAAPGWNEVTWDGRDRAGKETAPGTYFCRMTTEEGVRTTRLVLVR